MESGPQNQKGIKDAPTPAVPAGEHEGRQEQKSQEGGVEPRSASLVGSAEAGNQEDLEASEAVVTEQNCQDQVLQSEPAKDPVDAAERAGQVAGDSIPYAEETAAKDGHSLDKTLCTSNIYDDEIWEGPGAVM